MSARHSNFFFRSEGSEKDLLSLRFKGKISTNHLSWLDSDSAVGQYNFAVFTEYETIYPDDPRWNPAYSTGYRSTRRDSATIGENYTLIWFSDLKTATAFRLMFG